MLDWLIVGGGIHGTYLANLLTQQPHLAPEQVGILDPHDRLLAAWNRMIEDFNLPCNSCGYPIVGEDLQWGPNIFVTGPLAELQIGPCARNIVGARNAGRMLVASISAT